MSYNKYSNFLGLLGGLLTSAAFVPQVMVVYEKKIIHMPITTLLMFLTGQILWLIYGFLERDYSVLLFAFITAILYLYLLYAKLNY